MKHSAVTILRASFRRSNATASSSARWSWTSRKRAPRLRSRLGGTGARRDAILVNNASGWLQDTFWVAPMTDSEGP